MAESTQSDETATDQESRMIKAIVKDTVVAVPVALVLLFGAILVFTDNSVGDAVAAAVLPGVLIGVFFGGFSGTARTMN